MICYRIWPLQIDEVNKILVHIWPGNKLPSSMAWTDKVSGWCPTEFRAKLSPAVGLNLQCFMMVAIAFS